jgi:hypothetical protein
MAPKNPPYCSFFLEQYPLALSACRRVRMNSIPATQGPGGIGFFSRCPEIPTKGGSVFRRKAEMEKLKAD